MPELDKTPTEIHGDGAKARGEGTAVRANPYPSASPEFTAWDRGWRSLDPSVNDLPLDQRLVVETPYWLRAAQQQRLTTLSGSRLEMSVSVSAREVLTGRE